MNLPILSAQIVRCVHHSPDSAVNLEVVVSGLIREEMKRDADLQFAKTRDVTYQTLSQLDAQMSCTIRDLSCDFRSK